MKRACLFLILLLWAAASSPALLRAQISSSAFDPNCYQPRIGVPGEIDTIYGGHDGQGLGSGQFSLGPGPNSPYNRVLMGGYQNNPQGLDVLTSGPGFNLYDLNPPKYTGFIPHGQIYKAHFQNSKLTDLFSMTELRIYWADTNGNYDSSRFTALDYRSLGSGDGWIEKNIFDPYIARMTSDSVDDLIFGFQTNWIGKPNSDTDFVVHYKGGASIYRPGDTVYNDASAFFADTNLNAAGRGGTIGDFRGTGRSDYIASGLGGNIFFYKNDPPFDLKKFVDAMRSDTLLTFWENPGWKVPEFGDRMKLIATHILPKRGGDQSLDLDLSILRKDDPAGDYSENIFRGGPEFGSHRLFLKDTDLCVRSPAYYDPSFLISSGGVFGLYNCGDMTGTGNPVIEIPGFTPSFDYSFFYVMGQAADPFVDMYYSQYYGGGTLDTITADGDRLEDLIRGDWTYRTQGGTSTGVGTIEVIHGSRKIPVRLNPRFADVPPSIQSGDSLRIAPNPCSTHTVVTWESSCSGSVELELYDVMGRQVFQERRPTTGALESFSLDLPRLPNGEYFLVLLQEPCVQHGRIIVQE